MYKLNFNLQNARTLLNANKKYIALGTAAAFLTIILFMIFFKLIFIIKFSESDLKHEITSFFKKNLQKAVKFEEVYIDFAGNIIATNFTISESSDFNDNQSLIKSKKAVFNLKFFHLLIGNVKVGGIDFYDTEISFFKRFGKDYFESFNQVFALDKIKNINRKYFDGFRLRFYDTKFTYREQYRDVELIAELYDVFAKFQINEDEIFYKIKGNIKPFKSTVIKKGGIYITGSIDYEKGPVYRHSIEIDNIDLAYFNEYIKDNRIAEIALKGGLSTDLKIRSDKKRSAVAGKIEFNDLHMISLGTPVFKIITNENLNLDIDTDYSPDFKNVKLSRFILSDDVFAFSAEGDYRANEKEDKIRLSFQTDKIDLEDLCGIFTPVKDFTYEGKFIFKGKIHYDFKGNSAAGSVVELDVKKFGLFKSVKAKPVRILEEGALNITSNEKEILLKAGLKAGASDISIKAKSAIKSWSPFASDSELLVDCRKLNHVIPYYLLRTGIISLLESAQNDVRRGYEDNVFLQKPMGKFVNNNNLVINVNAQKLLFPGKASLKNLSLGLALKNGLLETKVFTLEGYDAKYAFSLSGLFNRDYPYVNMKGEIREFDMERFCRDGKFRGLFTGKMNLDFTYEVMAYRLLHLIENSKGDFNVNFTAGTLVKTGFQKNIAQLFRKTEFASREYEGISVDGISFSLSQLGENFYVKSSSFKSDKINFSAYGKYTIQSGFEVPFTASLRVGDKFLSAPLVLSGRLLSPCLKINDKKYPDASVCFTLEEF